MQVAASPAAGVALCGHSMHLIVGLQRTQHEFRNVGAQFWASLGACSFHFAIKAAVLGHVVAAIYAFSVAARAVMDREHAAMRDVAGVQGAVYPAAYGAYESHRRLSKTRSVVQHHTLLHNRQHHVACHCVWR